jgi:uncharacterized protein (TIGR02117 family)
MRQLIRVAGYASAAIAATLVVLGIVTARPADPALWPPKPGEPVTEIFVVSHGYHAGFALPTAQLAETAKRDGHTALLSVTERLGGFPFIEIGWGEEQFYSSVPTLSSLTPRLAMRALFNPDNASVLHVVALPDQPRVVFPSADVVRIALSEEGYARLVRAIEATFVTHGRPASPHILGRGLYRTSLFFRANGAFHMFSVCNHWVADMLSAAGLPVTPVLDTMPPGLLLDLKMRAGLDRLPELQP